MRGDRHGDDRRQRIDRGTGRTGAVASVSLAEMDGNPAGFAAALGASFERHGFAIVSDHRIPHETIARADEAAVRLFALPPEEKNTLRVPGSGGARGYTAFGTEAAKDAQTVDLKEFWHVGRELPDDHASRSVMAANVWPGIDGFREPALDLYAELERVGARLLSAIAMHLGLEASFFEDPTRDGNSILRMINYPPVDPSTSGVRAGAHEDINVITLLLGAEEPGLEILERDGTWLPVTPKPGELAVNVGDMLQRLTSGRMRSTTHRVVNPTASRRDRARRSMPFFHHFRPDYVIHPMTPPRGAVGTALPPITANDYLMQRLREIRLL